MNLEGAVAIVTGAARRVGRAIALHLARRGCDIALHYHRSSDDAESLAGQIREIRRRCLLVQADLAKPESWSRIVDETVNGLGSLDILVNNASIFAPMAGDGFDLAQWQHTMQVNLTAAAALCHHAAPHLRKTGNGKIVNITDIAAEKPWSHHIAYCASKAGLVNLTKALAKALAPDVQVNAVAPGIAIFPEDYDETTRARLIDKVPLKRAGTPEDIAAAVGFYCADGDYITGQVVAVDGGRSVA